MRIYLEIIKFNIYEVRIPRVKWGECCAPEPEPGIQLLAGKSKLFFFLLLFGFLFFSN